MTVFPFVMAGFNNSINPGAIAVIVLLVFSLMYLDFGRQEILVFAYAFIFSGLVGSLLWDWQNIVMGFVLDPITRWVCLSFAGVVSLFGLANFYDWVLLRSGKNKEKLLFQFPAGYSKNNADILEAKSFAERRKAKHFGLLVLMSASITGIVSGICISSFPPDAYLLVNVYTLMLEGNNLSAVAFLFIYHVVLILPMVVVFAIILLTQPWTGLIDVLEKHAPTAKIIMAGISLALGSGLMLISF